VSIEAMKQALEALEMYIAIRARGKA